MLLTKRQKIIQAKIKKVAKLFDIDPQWAVAIAMTESSLGEKQLSPTGCRGVFQMSSIAMKDLLQEMEKQDDDLIDIACGVGFLRLLLRRWKTVDEATLRFCNPKDRDFYLKRVQNYMESLNKGE
uniref:Putative transglycosylase n=1 Tax=viral metagenome TaxID=1070528 RepID=A0A6M3JA41_9ZZZZ